MNMSEAHKMSAAATDAVDGALSGLQLLLSNKKKERDARAAGYKTIIGIMESELEGVDAEIEQLEHILFGEKQPATPDAKALTDEEAEIFRRGMGGTALLLNGHDREAAE